MKLFFYITALCSSLVSAQSGGGPVQVGDKHQIVVSPEANSDIQPVSTNNVEIYKLTHPGASYMSVHFDNFDLPESCFMEVTNDDGSQSSTLKGYGRQQLRTFWAQHVTGEVVQLKVACREGEKASFEVDEYAAGYPQGMERKLEDDAGALSICGTDDKENAVCYKDDYPNLYEKGKAVARLLINGGSLCTGWLVSGSNLLMTNEHCIDSLSDARNTDYEFMGEEDNCSTDGCQLCSRGDIHEGTDLLSVSATWDYALIQLDSSRDPGAMYGYLQLDPRLPPAGELLFIPQHPGGRPKQFGIVDTHQADNECKVLTYSSGCSPTDMRYTCDTEGGSSGSPVLSRTNNKVVALHHCGGGCNGNLGAPIEKFYDMIKEYFEDPSPTPAPTPCEGKVMELEIVPDNYPEDISWEVLDSDGVTVGGGDQNDLEAELCLQPNDCYEFTIYDSWGDGLCCLYGEGYYTLSWDGVVIKEGAEYTNSETTEFGNCGGQTGSPIASPTEFPSTSPTGAPTASDPNDGFVSIPAFQATQRQRANGKLKPQLFIAVKNEDKEKAVGAVVHIRAHYYSIAGSGSDIEKMKTCTINPQGMCAMKLKAYDPVEYSALTVSAFMIDSDLGEYNPDENKKFDGCPLFSDACPEYTVTEVIAKA